MISRKRDEEREREKERGRKREIISNALFINETAKSDHCKPQCVVCCNFKDSATLFKMI